MCVLRVVGDMGQRRLGRHGSIDRRELSRKSFYNYVKFHRIIKDFIVQGGDPSGTGRGGESIYGPKFEDEFKAELKHTGAGILSMENAGPNTNRSQIFITLAPCPSLDGKHTIIGRVCRGMEIIKRLGSVQTDNNDSLLTNRPQLGAYFELKSIQIFGFQQKRLVRYIVTGGRCYQFFGGGSTHFLISRDGGGWINAATFLTGASSVGSIAIPIILGHAGMIETGAMFIEFTCFFHIHRYCSMLSSCQPR
ncbi:Peptidyl-prolyl cis-trans isomerase CYP18-2-like protein [Drosera capensis]